MNFSFFEFSGLYAMADVRRRWRTMLGRRTGRAAGSAWIEVPARRIFIFPTRAGWAYTGLLLVLLLGAINYNNNLVFGLCFLLAGLGLVTMLHAHRNLARLQVRVGPGRPGFVGDRLGYQIWLRPGDARARYALELEAVAGTPVLTHVPRSGANVGLHRMPPRRGRERLGAVRIGTCFPLGLFYAWARLDFEHTELAYPTPAPPGAPPPDRPDGLEQSGDRTSGRDDFRGLRSYHPGDSLRHVHWKALAREQGLLTKEFGTTRSRDCWLDFNLAPEAETEARLQRLCRWVLEAERDGLRYGLRLPGLEVAPARGDRHRDRCLAALATFPGSV